MKKANFSKERSIAELLEILYVICHDLSWNMMKMRLGCCTCCICGWVHWYKAIWRSCGWHKDFPRGFPVLCRAALFWVKFLSCRLWMWIPYQCSINFFRRGCPSGFLFTDLGSPKTTFGSPKKKIGRNDVWQSTVCIRPSVGRGFKRKLL